MLICAHTIARVCTESLARLCIQREIFLAFRILSEFPAFDFGACCKEDDVAELASKVLFFAVLEVSELGRVEPL